MKHILENSFGLLTIMLWAGAWCILPMDLHADQPNVVQVQSRIEQQLFASPEEAVKTLQTATQAKDQVALRAIFGPTLQDLLTGDPVQDANNAQKFAAVMAQGYRILKEGDDKATIEIGPNSWPMPVPLVKINGYWLFDTAAGKEEIINRHIGKDELNAIGICQAYVTAQQQYARINPDARQGIAYAIKGSHPLHGYYFKILTRQGKDAPGGRMDYMGHGDLTKGFALIAYPVLWGKSGIMTFIVNQDAHVYQQDLGAKTSQIASVIKEYNPDSHWALVQDQGVLSAVTS